MTDPISLNLAVIVHRVLTQQRGWSADAIIEELRIQPRTYRKYRKLLTEEFAPFQGGKGTPRLREVLQGEKKYLRLLDGESVSATDTAFTSRVAALHFSQLLLSFIGSDVSAATDDILKEFEERLGDRAFIVGHILKNVDRIFFHLPDAPKDYSSKNEIIQELTHSMIFKRQVRIRYTSASFNDLDLTLEPYTLAVHKSALYLIAKSVKYGDIRIYAVDRIDELETLSEGFEYPSPKVYNPSDYTDGSFGIYRGDADQRYDFEVIFANKRWLKMYVQERRWHPTQVFEELDDGRIKMTFHVNTDKEVWPWIRGFGDDIEVIVPKPD